MENVFEPLLAQGGPLAHSVGRIIGVGAGRAPDSCSSSWDCCLRSFLSWDCSISAGLGRPEHPDATA